MQLGDKGHDWMEGLYALYTDSRSLTTSWQQDFLDNMWTRVENFGGGTFVSEKQLEHLNKIADIYGWHVLKRGDILDQD
jgi:hypothetical protein